MTAFWRREAPWLFFILLVAWAYSHIPWEWGVMDDGGLYQQLHRAVAEVGVVKGVAKNTLSLADFDVGSGHWGLLRPSYWVYASLIYLLPVGWAYAVRMLMLLCIFLSSARVVARAYRDQGGEGEDRTIALLSLLALLTIRSLYDGLGMVSLQEATGLFFVALALSVFARENFAHGRLEQLAFLGMLFVAIGFKSPFLWLLPGTALIFAFGLGKKGWGAAVFLSFFAWLALSAYFSMAGFYTKHIFHLTAENLFHSALSFVKHAAVPVLFVGLFGAAGQRSLRGFAPKRDKWAFLAFTLVSGGALYLATLLPRGIVSGFGYYLSPPIFLMLMGSLLILVRGWRCRFSRRWVWAAAALPAFAMATYGVRTVWRRNVGIVFVRDWALKNGGGQPSIGVNAIEVPVRLNEILSIRSEGKWAGRFVEVSGENPENLGKVRYYVVFDDQMAPAEFQGELLEKHGSAALWRLAGAR